MRLLGVQVLIARGQEASGILASAELYTLNLPTLTVTLAGAGRGTVTSDPAGISCPGTCSASFPLGTSVTLTASATTDSSFTGWSGEVCRGTGTCTASMTEARNVTAIFSPPGTCSVFPLVGVLSQPFPLNFALIVQNYASGPQTLSVHAFISGVVLRTKIVTLAADAFIGL